MEVSLFEGNQAETNLFVFGGVPKNKRHPHGSPIATSAPHQDPWRKLPLWQHSLDSVQAGCTAKKGPLDFQASMSVF